MAGDEDDRAGVEWGADEDVFRAPPPGNPAVDRARQTLVAALEQRVTAQGVSRDAANRFRACWDGCPTIHALHAGALNDVVLAQLIDIVLMDAVLDPVGIALRKAKDVVEAGSVEARQITREARRWRQDAAILRRHGDEKQARRLERMALAQESSIGRRRRGAPLRNRILYLLEWTLAQYDDLGTNRRWRLIARLVGEWTGAAMTADAVRSAVLRTRKRDDALPRPCATDPLMMPPVEYLVSAAEALERIGRLRHRHGHHNCGRRISGVHTSVHYATDAPKHAAAARRQWTAMVKRVTRAPRPPKRR